MSDACVLMALVSPAFSPSQLKSWMFSTWEYISLGVYMQNTIKKKINEGFPDWLSGKEVTCQCKRHRWDP